MILPHDADKTPSPEDGKAFGAFVLFVLIGLGLVIRCSANYFFYFNCNPTHANRGENFTNRIYCSSHHNREFIHVILYTYFLNNYDLFTIWSTRFR